MRSGTFSEKFGDEVVECAWSFPCVCVAELLKGEEMDEKVDGG